jgi:integrase/recombinase XerD
MMDLVPNSPTDIIMQATSDISSYDLKTLLAGQVGESSIAMYKRDVNAYDHYCKDAGLYAMDPQSLAIWRDSLALSGKMSPNTINRMLSAVKRLVKEASIRGLVDAALRVQFADIPGVKHKAMKAQLKKHSRTRISKEDMRRLCEIPDAHTLLGKRDRAMLAVLASSGIRCSEVATLTTGQIVKRDGGYILQVCGKTDTEYREANVSREAIALVNAWLAARPLQSEAIFTSFSTRAAHPTDRVISETGVWQVVQKYASRCGLEHIKPHDFRRFLGTQLAKVDIRKAQKALGHKSIEVTARHYVLDDLEVGQTDNLY